MNSFAFLTYFKIVIGRKLSMKDLRSPMIPTLGVSPFLLISSKKTFNLKHILFIEYLKICYCSWRIWKRTIKGPTPYLLIGPFNKMLRVEYCLEHHAKHLLLCNAFKNTCICTFFRYQSWIYFYFCALKRRVYRPITWVIKKKYRIILGTSEQKPNDFWYELTKPYRFEKLVCQ